MNASYRLISESADPNAVLTIPVPNHTQGYSHWFLGIEFLDAVGDVVSAGLGGGPLKVEIETWCSPGVFQEPQISEITPAQSITIDWQPSPKTIKITPVTDVVGATTYRVRVMAYQN